MTDLPVLDLRRVRAQITKELTQIVRDKTSLGLAVVLPLVLMVLLGTAISLTVHDAPIVVQDLDQTPLSRQLCDVYRASLTFRVVPWPPQRAPVQALETSAARAAVIIPEHFGRDLLKGRAAGIEVLVDATDSNTANIMRGSLTALTSSFAQQQPRGITSNVRLWYNPGRDERAFIGPGAFAVALGLLPPLLAALAMSRERENKTILQVYVSGVPAHEYLLGKVLAYAAIAAVDWLLGMVLLYAYFGLHLRGDPTPYLLGSAVFILTTISFAAMVGVRVPDQATAIQVMQLGGFFLAFLLSGFIYPLDNIPPQLRWISNVTPARYYIEMVRDAFLRGGGWPALWPSLLALTLLGTFFFAMAWKRLRPMQLEA